MRRITAAAMALSAVVLVASATPAPAAAGAMHVVQPGENLYRIALRYGVSVSVLAAYNQLSDPTRLSVGQVLRIPPTGTSSPAKKSTAKQTASQIVTYRYTVNRGDSLGSIARRFGTTVEVLKRANSLQSNLIHPGQRLVVPGVRVAMRVPPPGPMIMVKAPPESSAETPAPSGSDTGNMAVGDTVTIQPPLRVRRGPGTYFTILALVAPQTQLPVTAASNGWVELQLPDGESGWARQEDLRGAPVARSIGKGRATTGDAIVREAMQYVGTRYLWGGRSSGGLDCSGLVYVVFASFAPDLGRLSSYDYFRMGVPVDQTDLRPGDLVFFTTYAPGASHVGIYVGERKFIHAASSIQQVTIATLSEPYYVTRYIGARRLVAPTASVAP